MAITVMDALSATVRRYPQKTAIRYKDPSGWKSISWTEYNQTVRKLAKGLTSLGLAPGGFTAILGSNSKEWVFSDIASIMAGAVPAGIYPTSSPDQCAYILSHCQAQCIFVSDAQQLAKIQEIRPQLTHLKFIVLFDGKASGKDVYTFNEVLSRAAKCSDEELEQRIKSQKPSDLATLVYTSGTTSNPKAVMLSHHNLTWMAKVCQETSIKVSPDDVLISYLPLSHIAEQMITIHAPIFCGCEVSYVSELDKLPSYLCEVRPTLFLGVPRVWEKIQAKMVQKGAAASPLKKMIARWAKRVGLEAGDDVEKQKSLSFRIAKKLVFSKVREALGLDRCRLQVTAAAPISRETLDFFMSLNVPLYEVFGMSESTGPVTISTPGHYKVGKTGTCVEGAEIKIAEDGEILIRGPLVCMGYLHNEEATRDTIDNKGWLHTGDLGDIDTDGFLAITGRKKNLIITAGGENIAPELLENKLKTIPEVEQAVVVGDRQRYLSALITLNDSALEMARQKEIKTSAKNVYELAQCSGFQAYLDRELNRINQEVARVQTIKKIKVLPTTLTEEAGELTPTMKVKRNVVLKKFDREIQELYAS